MAEPDLDRPAARTTQPPPAAPAIADAPADAVATGRTPGTRDRWMDTLRGSAILLVVLWHSAAVLPLYGYPPPTYLLRFNETFASYRMPALMFLSGILLARSLSKPLAVYAVGKARRILWPLLLWGLLFYVITDPPTAVWQKVNWTTPYLWFLLYILVFYAAAPFLRFLPTLVLVVVPWAMTQVPGLSENERRFYFLAGFFFLGKLCADHRHRFDAVLTSRRTWLLAAAVVPFSVVFAVAGPWRYWGVLALFSVAGTLLAIKIARLPVVQARTGILQFVGRNSIIYYCSHFPVLIGVVRTSRHFSVPVALVIVFGLVAALAVGFGLSFAARSRAFAWLFVAPVGASIAAGRSAGPWQQLLERRSPNRAVAVAQVVMSVLALAALLGFGLRII